MHLMRKRILRALIEFLRAAAQRYRACIMQEECKKGGELQQQASKREG